jgi:hypothetical protein
MWAYFLMICLSAPDGVECYGGWSAAQYRAERDCEAAAERQHDNAEAVFASGDVPLLLVQTKCLLQEQEAMS